MRLPAFLHRTSRPLGITPLSPVYRLTITGIWLTAASLALVLIGVSQRQIDADVNTIARERGIVLFRMIETTRDWNARHGGVYVPVTESTQPNPYLEHPRRDITDNLGRQLTLINPAFMTRQIAEIAASRDGAHFHITSTNPIRPANKPDPWEFESLRRFEQGEIRERLSFFAQGSSNDAAPVHRYMAPLYIKQACLQCHAKQGYHLNDVRGGISVTMPADALLALAAERKRLITLLYLAGALVLASLGHLIAWRSRRHMHALEEINLHQEAIIAARTEEVTKANASLEWEVAEAKAAKARLDESQARYRAVIESSQDGIVILENRWISFVNERFCKLLNHRPDELIGTELSQWIAPEDADSLITHLRHRRLGEYADDLLRLRLIHRDGYTRIHADMHMRNLPDIHGGEMTVVVITDMTARLEAEKESLIAAAVFESAAEAILVTDRENRIIRVNPAFTAITGYTPGEVLGQDPKILRSGRHGKDFYKEMWARLEMFGRWEGEIWNRRKDGHLYVEWLSITTIRGDAGEGRHVATFIDITQRKEAEESILHQASHDALTGLPNRSLFADRLKSALASASRHKRSVGLMYLDLDYFKQVNDQFGHSAGDDLLVEVARRMRQCVRDSDTLARLGGDEFGIILSEINHHHVEAEEVARRLNASLAQPYDLAEGTAHVSASIGIALYPEHGEDELTLRRAADRALYATKSAGRNGFRFVSEADQGKS